MLRKTRNIIREEEEADLETSKFLKDLFGYLVILLRCSESCAGEFSGFGEIG